MKLNTHYASGFTILQFNNENKEIGRLWNDGGKLAFDGNATEAAHQLFKHLIREYDDFISLIEGQNNELHAELLAMEHDRDHWKANHDHQVECARVLKTRRDIPIDRCVLHEALLALGVEGDDSNPTAKGVVTKLDTLNHVLEVYEAARKLVQCKGRYHAELNYKALAELFGVTNIPEPREPNLMEGKSHFTSGATPGQLAAMEELTALTEDMGLYTEVISPEAFDKISQLVDEPPAPSEALRELMTRPRRYIDDTKNDALLGETLKRMSDAVKNGNE